MLTALGAGVGPGGGPGVRRRRLRGQAVQPAGAGPAGRPGARPQPRGRRIGRRRSPSTTRGRRAAAPIPVSRTARRGGAELSADQPRVRPAALPAAASRAGVQPGRADGTRCGAGRSATSRPSPCTCAGCGRRSSTTRPGPPGSSRSGASATGWTRTPSRRRARRGMAEWTHRRDDGDRAHPAVGVAGGGGHRVVEFARPAPAAEPFRRSEHRRAGDHPDPRGADLRGRRQRVHVHPGAGDDGDRLRADRAGGDPGRGRSSAAGSRWARWPPSSSARPSAPRRRRAGSWSPG